MNEVEWGSFSISDVFESIRRGKRLKNGDHISGRMPYVSSSAVDNGVDDFVSNDVGVRIFERCMTIANSGSVGTCFYQPFAFVASDHVTSLSNPILGKYEYLFVSAIMSRLSEKYSFNHEISDDRMRRERIVLPCTGSCEPDWEYMRRHMMLIEARQIGKYLSHIGNSDLSPSTPLDSAR